VSVWQSPIIGAGKRIPELDLALQATELVAPVVKWGRIARTSRMDGTYYFYTCDTKFRALWSNPDQLPDSGCRVAVEPNYSSWPDMDPARLREGIYRKRWLARHWQSRGVRVVVDLNVDPAFRDVALLGVPKGWRAYAVRHQSGIGLDEIEADFEHAARHAGTRSLFFCVFGGWHKVRDLCAERNWLWHAEDIHRARGSTDGTRPWK
jgi:hypothetical protein